MQKKTKKTTNKKTTKKTNKKTVKKPNKKVSKTASCLVAEKEDDRIIVGSLKGQLLPFFVYQYCEEGCKTREECTHELITVPTVKGVSEVIHFLNKDPNSGYKIKLKPELQKIENNIYQGKVIGAQATCVAYNEIDGTFATGIKFEPYWGAERGQKNEFALEKAISKAERNAFRKIVSEIDFMETLEKIMEKYPKAVKFIQSEHSIDTEAETAPIVTTGVAIEDTIRKAIEQAKEEDQLKNIQEKVKNGNLSADFKKEIKNTISDKIKKLKKINEEITYEEV